MLLVYLQGKIGKKQVDRQLHTQGFTQRATAICIFPDRDIRSNFSFFLFANSN